MSFLAPWHLLWLAAFLPPLVLMYFLKIRRKPQPVSSIMLWQKSLQDLRANVPFQRLRRNLLLWLQILVFLLFAVALARPVIRGSAFSGKRLVLMIDRSASMGARDEDGRTRFEKALAKARTIAEDPERGEVMVMAFSDRASVELPFSSSFGEIRRAIDRIEPSDEPTRIADAIRIAEAAAEGKEDVKVVLLSDGKVGALPGESSRPLEIEFIRVGKRGRNVAVTGLSLRRGMDRTETGVHLFVEISNFSPARRQVPLEIRHEGDLVDAARWTIDARDKTSRTFRFPDVESGLLTVRADVEDDLPCDDEASVVVNPPRRPRVLLVTGGNVFLENALQAVSGVDLEVVAPEEVQAAGEPFDVAVLDASLPPVTPPARAFLTFGIAPPGAGMAVTGALTDPLFGNGDWLQTHPVNRYVEYANLYVRKALRVSLPAEAEVLLESRAGPLLAALSRGSVKHLAVLFDIRDSDWAFQVSFPLFLRNAVDWLSGPGGAGSAGRWCRTGEPIVLPSARGRMVTPTGGVRSAAGHQEGKGIFTGTDRAGVYTLEDGDVRKRFPVNLVDPGESDVEPADRLSLGSRDVRIRAAEDVVYRETWPWFLLAGLAVLLVEWWVYHRRAM